MTEHIATAVRDGVFRIQLDRPDKMNAVGTTMAEGLRKACESAAADPGVRCVVIGGNGKAFCAGADLSATKERSAAAWMRTVSDVLQRLYHMPCPVIAAVHGYALGLGAGLALAADFVIAEEDATIGFPEVHHGLVPGVIAAFLRNRADEGRMAELLFLGEKLTALDAKAKGLVYQVAPAGELDACVDSLAGKLISVSPTAIRITKRLMRDMASLGPREAVRAGEAAVLMGRETEDAKEGMGAFRDRRRPVWTGR